MSWSALIMHFGDAKTIDECPPDFNPPPVATSTELRALLERLFPDAEHEPERSHLTGEDYWLELEHACHTDEDGNVSCVGIRSNAGPGAIPQIKRLCDALGARLFDVQTSEIADLSQEIEDSMQHFSEWRDRAQRSS